jgi:hypothetical protein
MYDTASVVAGGDASDRELAMAVRDRRLTVRMELDTRPLQYPLAVVFHTAGDGPAAVLRLKRYDPPNES